MYRKSTQGTSRSTQEAPRVHPKHTQGAHREHPGAPRRHQASTQEYPGSTQRGLRKNSGSTQEHPGAPRGAPIRTPKAQHTVVICFVLHIQKSKEHTKSIRKAHKEYTKCTKGTQRSHKGHTKSAQRAHKGRTVVVVVGAYRYHHRCPHQDYQNHHQDHPNYGHRTTRRRHASDRQAPKMEFLGISWSQLPSSSPSPRFSSSPRRGKREQGGGSLKPRSNL